MPDLVLRLPAVLARVGLSRSSIYRAISAGQFPKPVSLGARAIGFLESEIDEWLRQRVEARQVIASNIAAPIAKLGAGCDPYGTRRRRATKA